MSQAPEVEIRRLIYVADPMCSWCWGFAPVIRAAAERYADAAEMLTVMGGLRAGNTQPMDEGMKGTIRGHWQHVAEATGQPFDYAFFDRQGFVYDTEPPCRGVVTVRQLEPPRTLEMLHGLHRAFYAENRDVTRAEVIADVAAEIGLDRQRFLADFESEAVMDATRGDFAFTAQIGVSGFPTLLAQTGQEMSVVTVGYRPLDDVTEQLDRLFVTP